MVAVVFLIQSEDSDLLTLTPAPRSQVYYFSSLRNISPIFKNVTSQLYGLFRVWDPSNYCSYRCASPRFSVFSSEERFFHSFLENTLEWSSGPGRALCYKGSSFRSLLEFLFRERGSLTFGFRFLFLLKLKLIMVDVFLTAFPPTLFRSDRKSSIEVSPFFFLSACGRPGLGFKWNFVY